MTNHKNRSINPSQNSNGTLFESKYYKQKE